MEMLRAIRRLDSTAVALILANLVPLYGVFAWGWAVFPILFLFWFENIVIGFFNAARMLTARPAEPVLWAGKLFLVAFFCVHYGMFTAVHGSFVLSLFGDMADASALPDIALVTDVIAREHLLLPVLALVASHGYSFVVNFVLRGEYREASPKQLMARPYGRIVLLHVTIIAGGALLTALDAPLAGLVLLIALKIAMDLHSHLRAHARELP
ncbi:DUF6498-containing protein [Lentisalinibacter salinarum]|uniref:DUF6498-containing protein n=1 Tax=Lentisalinibacter salinarum TaxID=2992239 RepID=UPI003862DFA6